MTTVNVRNYSLSETIIASIRLSDQIAFVVLLLVLFSCLSGDGPLSHSTATAVVVLVSLLLFLIFLVTSDDGQREYEVAAGIHETSSSK